MTAYTYKFFNLKKTSRAIFLFLLLTLILSYFLFFYYFNYASFFANFTKLDSNHPLVFVGGMPRSGTTLLRAILDAHSMVRCGEETRVIPRILGIRSRWRASAIEWRRLQQAGVSSQVIDSAVSAFIREVIVGHGEVAAIYCNKDPFVMKSASYLHSLFPRAKFVFMVRDARAVVHSIITRKVTISNFDLSNKQQCLQRWNKVTASMYAECVTVGPQHCFLLHYEALVLRPRKWVTRLAHFLNIPWEEALLHHEQSISKPGGISLSSLEKSTDQVQQKINLDALYKWVDFFPPELEQNLSRLCPMMDRLEYDTQVLRPNYSAYHWV